MATGNSAVAELYLSLPLSRVSKCVRVLDVQPPTKSQPDGGPVQGDLHIIDLEQNTSFSALSYVWGPQSSPPKTILCGNFAVPVTDSCYSALVHLRKKPGVFPIWIDAICINQESTDEKQQQISLMGSIYGDARQVYVWLGDGTTGTDKAIEYMRTSGLLKYYFVNGNPDDDELQKPRSWAAFLDTYISRWSFIRHCNPFWKDDLNWFWRIRPFRRARQRSSALTASYHDLDELLSREWVKRIWTYQEIMLASNPIVVCGNHHMEWSHFIFAIVFLDYIRPEYAFDFTSIGPMDGWKKVLFSRDRPVNLDVPIVSAIATWKKIGLVRERIIALTKRFDINKAQTSRSERLRRYQKFVHQVSWRHTVLRKFKPIFVFLPFLVFVFSIILIANDVVENNTPPKPRPSTSDSVSCVRSCEATNQTACMKECSPADMAKSVQEDIVNWHPTGYTVLPWFAVPSAMVLILLLAFINSQLPPNAPFPRVNRSLREREMKQDAVYDLVDGISTRKATNPLDMTFGMQSVMQKLLNRTLPTPDYTRLREDLYKEMTVNLLEATGSLQILISAALHHLDGSPSWVSNWAAEFPDHWLKPLQLYQGFKGASSYSAPYWKVTAKSGSIESLTVYGHRICTISTCYRFIPTSNSFQECEKDAHLRNMELMLMLFMFHFGALELEDYIKSKLNHPGLPHEIGSAQLHAYLHFLAAYCWMDPSEALLLLTTGESTNAKRVVSWWLRQKTSFQQILDTHIAICNSLVHTQRDLFFTEDLKMKWLLPPGNSEISRNFGRTKRLRSKQNLGFCSYAAQTGDKVILVSGLSIPLVVREHGNSLRLVSPAIMMDVMEGQAWDGRKPLEEFVLA